GAVWSVPPRPRGIPAGRGRSTDSARTHGSRSEGRSGGRRVGLGAIGHKSSSGGDRARFPEHSKSDREFCAERAAATAFGRLSADSRRGARRGERPCAGNQFWVTVVERAEEFQVMVPPSNSLILPSGASCSSEVGNPS